MFITKVLGAGAILILSISLHSTESAILFPDEITSLTSLAFSLLPPVKLGQDSRFGFGFRLGRNADAQVLVELGPQTNTVELGKSSSKRHTDKVPQQPSDRKRKAQKRKNIIMKRREKTTNSSIDKTQ